MVKIRHLGRALLGLVTLFVLGTGTKATAQTISALGDKLTAVPTAGDGSYYVLQSSSNSWYIQEGTSSLVPYTSSDLTTSESDGLKCVVKFTDAGSGNYHIQMALGNYWSSFTGSGNAITTTNSSSSAGTFSIAVAAGNSSAFNIKDVSNSIYLDATSSTVISWGWWASGNDESTGNNIYYIIPVTLEGEIQSATVTYNYYIGSVAESNKYGDSSESTLTVGSTIAAPSAPDKFTTYKSATATQNGSEIDMTTAITSSEDITVNVILEPNLPFTVSTDDTKYYYAFDIHHGDTGTDGMGTGTTGTRTWLISYDGSTLAKNNTSYDTNEVLDDAYLWYVTGNLVNGFKFYNKNSGENFLTMPSDTTSSSSCTMGTDETKGLFKLCANTSDTNAFSLKIEGYSNYLNKNGVLGGYTSADNGSAIYFRPASYFPQRYYTDVIATCNSDVYSNAPEGALGVRTTVIDYSAATTAYNNSTASTFDDDATSRLVEANTAAKTTIDGTTIAYNNVPSDLTGFYRLVNFDYGTTLSSKAVVDDWGTSYPVSATLTADVALVDATSILQFVKNGDNDNYSILINGQYIGATTEGKATAFPAEAGYYYKTTNSSGKFSIQDVTTNTNRSYLHCSSSQASAVVGWGTDASATFWYIVPATELDVAVTTVEGKGYATGYYPFTVSGVEGATAYVGRKYKESDANTLVMKEATAVAANNGLLLVGETGATAKLTIGTDESASTSNVLTGTLTAITFSDDILRSNYLVFGIGSNDGKAGFYTPSEKVTSIPANRAYIANPSPSTIHLDFGDGTTGIDAATLINGEQNNAPVYDLSGRRVTKATRGLYIQGGKKYIAR